MKSRTKILSGISLLSLIFIAGIETNAQVTKEKGWVRAVYSAEQDMTVVEANNLTIRDSIHNPSTADHLFGREEDRTDRDPRCLAQRI